MDLTADELDALPAAPDAGLAPLREQFLEALETLGEASRGVHQALDDAAAAFIVVREHVEQAGNVSDFTGVIQPIPLRAALTSSLNDLEKARHRVRRLLFRLLYTEGKSMSEIARMWGISRQLVSRLLNEPDD